MISRLVSEIKFQCGCLGLSIERQRHEVLGLRFQVISVNSHIKIKRMEGKDRLIVLKGAICGDIIGSHYESK